MLPRHARILELLTERERLEVQALSEQLHVSQVTIRKDLTQLADRGLIRREHGGAVLASRDDLSGRLAYHHLNKARIAALAAAQVADGETILIESGSCCALLAEQLALTRRDIRILTNSAFIAGFVRRHPGVSVTLLGGAYQPSAQVMVGPLVGRCLEGVHVQKLFIGVDGYMPPVGFQGSDSLRADAVRAMAAHADGVMVLTESEKLTKPGTVPLLALQDVTALFTDDRLDAGWLDRARGTSIAVYLASGEGP